MQLRPKEFKSDNMLDIETDIEKVQSFIEKTGKRIGVLYESPFHILVVDLVTDRSGRQFAYERLLKKSTKSGVVTIAKCEKKFVLIKQFRHAIRDYQYSFVRGFAEDDLSIEENAVKELTEELGANVVSCKRVGNVIADSGICGASVCILACELDKINFDFGHEGICEYVLMSDKELKSAIASGKITDGFTLAAWALLNSQE